MESGHWNLVEWVALSQVRSELQSVLEALQVVVHLHLELAHGPNLEFELQFPAPVVV